jgi:hypothetical protein
MEQYKEIKWKTTSDLPIDDWKKLAKLFIEEKKCFEESKSAFGNHKLYRVIVFNLATRDFTPHFLIKANVPGDFYHTGSYHTFGRITISELYWSLEFLSNCKDIYLVKEENMETKEIKISVHDGYEIDKEKSTFECIKFKPIKSKFSNYDGKYRINGYYISDCSSSIMPYNIHMTAECYNCKSNKNIFATEKQAKSALAMAQISQIIANDERFGGVITDEEFNDKNKWIYAINRDQNTIRTYEGTHGLDHFLSFHTLEQRDLFLKENEDLVKDYLMID